MLPFKFRFKDFDALKRDEWLAYAASHYEVKNTRLCVVSVIGHVFLEKRKHLGCRRLVRVFRFDTYFKKWGIEYRQLVKQNRKYLTLSSQVYFHTHINDPHMLEHMLGDEKLFYDRDGWMVRSCVYSRVFHFMITCVA